MLSEVLIPSLGEISDALLRYGYLGIFFISFLGSLVIFIPVPYFLPVVLLVIADQNADLAAITFASALGSTLAKTVVFQASYTGRRLMSEDMKQRIIPFQRLVGRYGLAAAFLAAATPIPDDLIYIPLGLAKYDLKRFFPATLAGKIILTGIIVYGARFLGRQAIDLLIGGTQDWRIVVLSAAGFIALLAGTIYAIVRIDWAKALARWFPWTLETPDTNPSEEEKSRGETTQSKSGAN